MKRLFQLLLFVALAGGMAACNKDECKDVTCMNGGTCNEGVCDCTDGYEGMDCSTEKVPDRVRLTKIVVTGFPAFKNGSDAWDNDLTGSDVAPDIYLSLQRAAVEVYQSPIKPNADPNNDHQFDLNPAIDLFPEGQQYKMYLLDGDGAGLYDIMGEIDFFAYQSGKNFPAMIEIKDNNGIEMELYVEYVFE